MAAREWRPLIEVIEEVVVQGKEAAARETFWSSNLFADNSLISKVCMYIYIVTYITIPKYSLPSINVNPQEWIKVNIYRGVNN
jgi:hypothetical protein